MTDGRQESLDNWQLRESERSLIYEFAEQQLFKHWQCMATLRAQTVGQ